jgi:aminoglycoside phosphotransferase (APT) family kinase protein
MPFGLYIKYGFRVNRSEAYATTFVGMHTTIPVPRVRDCIEEGGITYILMTKVPGDPVFHGVAEMSPQELNSFVETLRDWTCQLRALHAPSGAVAHFDGGPCWAKRITEGSTCGPFTSVVHLHEFLVAGVTANPLERQRLRLMAEQKSHSRPHRVCFTHNDLDPSNLLVMNRRLTGLVDFGCAGWYPEYWDFTTAVFGRGYLREYGYTEWIDAWRRVYPQYQDELDVEYELWCNSSVL